MKKTILMLAVIVAVAGCGKKPAATAPPADTTTAAAPAPEASAGATPVIVQNVNQSLTEVDAELHAKAYAKAVQTLLAVQQQKQLTEQQAMEARNKMTGLQRSLAQALASGDPNAKAAAALLHQSAMH